MQVQAIELAPLTDQAGAQSAAPAERLQALSGVKTELTIVAGQASSTVGDVLNLQAGTVLPLNTPLNAPFDVMLGTTLIARAELVAVGEHFGVRIVQVQPGTPA
jgi:flagellar motor switch protein FliN